MVYLQGYVTLVSQCSFFIKLKESTRPQPVSNFEDEFSWTFYFLKSPAFISCQLSQIYFLPNTCTPPLLRDDEITTNGNKPNFIFSHLIKKKAKLFRGLNESSTSWLLLLSAQFWVVNLPRKKKLKIAQWWKMFSDFISWLMALFGGIARF